MLRENVNDLLAFIVVARERSFTRAAAQLGMSQSGLSHAIRGLEERLGLRLLTRTTRSVAPTAEGEQLLETIVPRFEEVEMQLSSLTDHRDRPAGIIRITAEDYAIDAIIWPKIRDALADFPDVKVEFMIDYGLTDIVAERFDAGVRLGEIVSQGMISVPISGDQRMIVIASPSYLEKRGTPRVPQDLTGHNCINLRLPTHGGLYSWEFEKAGEELRVRVDGQMTFNGIGQICRAAVDGYGLGFVPDGLAIPHIEKGRLVQVLGDWCPPYTGYHLFYPNKRQSSAAFKLVVDALRYRR
ncbi:LysR family transcriptional regulator [Rhizobium sp. PP-F2F-G38]|uniref:LysR family transcriptional regulator n=1 Tax=Rhizobium sp. PP-CC-3G-465 TaxID=2135648 RepID=UPI000D82F3AF|nr:LysR family transcriptional regulator [Rhizobium sp. PP-F2F-G38]TCP80701.1 LysR family transcriptional regulator [Rhizobium sp. PP-CC-2G-626]TCQ19347.1 LysR family transcriptional regulator [Rhizobium sp. PP-CC-3G-465]